MTRLETLQALKDRIAEAKGPMPAQAAHEWAAALYPRDHDSNELLILALAGDISALGAVVALIEREMPGWAEVSVQRVTDNYAGFLEGYRGYVEGARLSGGADAPTPALALLSAFISALIAKEQSNG